MFAGKKSAQIREILISESAWEEMTCLFAPSLVVLPYSLGIVVASVLGVLAGLCVDLAEERKQMAKTESDMPLVETMENE